MSQTRHSRPHAAPPGAVHIDEGDAFAHLARHGAGAAHARAGQPGTRDAPPRLDVIVIGGGQAGLSVGHHLKRHGLRFVILEAHPRVGDAWRRRWDSLRLFTPAAFDALDGMRFPAAPGVFPTKDEMADFLESYAARFDLPVRTGVRVDRLSRENGRYVVRSGDLRLEAEQVVVAMANYQAPRTPPFARALDPAIVQIHSADYRNPSQLREGGVLIVGAGNSGSEIAVELARAGRRVWMSGRDTGHIPFRTGSFVGRHVLVRLVLRGLFHRVLTVDTPLGRKVRPAVLARGGPLIRVMPRDLAALGVRRVPRVAGVRGGVPVLEDGTVPEVSNVVWCTGFHPNFGWIDLPVFDASGEPVHRRGVAGGSPGLYFVGLHFQYALSSTMIHGVGRDARHVTDRVLAGVRAARGAAAA